MPRTNGSDDSIEHLTKRERAAIAAMQGLLAAGGYGSSSIPDTKHFAFIAVAAADALFDELDKS